LEGVVVIVTGAAGGQGALECELMASRGAAVIVADVAQDQGLACTERIMKSGGRAVFEHLDVTDEQAWARVSQRAFDEFGRIDALVNNAGIAHPARLAEVDHDSFQRMMDINCFGALLGTRTVAPMMAQGGGGSVVNISSIAGLTAWPSAAYTMSKWALTGLTKLSAMELGQYGIRVNSVHPGIIETAMTAHLADEIRQRYCAAAPLGRLGLAEDLAPLVAFLCSEESSYISGAELTVDGGFVAAAAAISVHPPATRG
jgi:3alpha(or 20beta)-hydroxysteroid dehydrogenase